MKYVPNNYKDNLNGTITDLATGLMWRQAGSDWLAYRKSRQYVQELNREHFAGYKDWRLPTIDELTSLLELEKQSNDHYIDPIFDSKQWWCWNSDTVKGSSGLAWDVNFYNGSVTRLHLDYNYYVRLVCAGQ